MLHGYKLIFASVASLAALGGHCAVAMADTLDTDDATITVTANRTPTALDQVASSVTIITAQDMADAHDTFVIDVLRDVPGVVITQTGGPGGLAEVYMRGGGPDQVLVELDGVPLNDPISPQGSYDQLGQLTVDNIERIEVLRGPQSMLYGSKALAGVISIITKHGHGKPTAHLTLEGGNNNSAEGSLSAGGSVKGWQYSASGSHFYTNGISFSALSPTPRTSNPYDNTTFSGRVDRSLTPDFSIEFLGRYTQGNAKIAGFDDNGLAIDSTSTERTEEKTFRLGGDWHPQKGRLTSTIGLSTNAIWYTYNFEVPPMSPPDIEPYYGLSYQVDWQANYVASGKNLVTFGAQSLTDQGQFSSSFDSLNQRSLWSTGFFAQDQLSLTSKWDVTLGVRNDNHETFGDKTTYRVGSTYKLNAAGTLLKATYGTGFKAPVLYELYDPLYGNPALKPELSESWDGGIEQPIANGKGAVSATYFHTDYTNLIDFVVTDPATFAGTYDNVAGAKVRGVELAASIKPAKTMRIKLSYTNTDAVDQNGVTLSRRPRHVYTLSSNYQASRKLELNLNGTAVSDRLDDAAFPPARLSPYFLINLAGTYKMSAKTSAFLRVDNLLNQNYEAVYSYRTPGIGVFGGLSESF